MVSVVVSIKIAPSALISGSVAAKVILQIRRILKMKHKDFRYIQNSFRSLKISLSLLYNNKSRVCKLYQGKLGKIEIKYGNMYKKHKIDHTLEDYYL